MNKLDGSVDYDMQLTTPSGALGNEANKALTGLVGNSAVTMPKDIIIDLNVKGPYDKTKVTITKTNFGEIDKTAVKDAAISELKNSDQAKQAQAELDKAKAQTEAEIEKQKQALEAQQKAAEDSLKKVYEAEKLKQQKILEQKKKAAEDSAKKAAANSLKKNFPIK